MRIIASILLGAVLTGAQPDVRLPAFTDIASESRFDYVTNNGLRDRKYFPQPMCGGVALFDFDNDGKLDVYFTNGAQLPGNRKVDPGFHHALLRNKGDSRFEDVTAKSGLRSAGEGYALGVAAADYDNDGYTDLFVAFIGGNRLYRNGGDGTFADVTKGSGLDLHPQDLLSVAGAWFDADGDGRLDLVVANYTNWTPEMDKRCGAEGKAIYCDPRLYASVPHHLYRNLGKGRFENITVPSGFGEAKGKGMGISIADLNGDTWPDVFIANDTERNFVYLNQGGGKFQEAGLLLGAAFNDEGQAVSSMGCDVRDYDNDGWPDIFYNDLAGQTFGLFHNEAGQGFRYVSQQTGVERISRRFSGWGAAFADFDNDGWKDIYSANGHVDDVGMNTAQRDTIFRNTGGRTFVDVSLAMGKDFVRPGYQRGAAVGDLNNDGFPDLVVSSLGQRPRILINSGVTGNHWITIALTGGRSNRDAIGATVKVTTRSGRALYNHVNPSVGFLSSSDKRLIFGLGGEAAVREIRIVWPSGRTTVRKDPAVDSILHLTEPD